MEAVEDDEEEPDGGEVERGADEAEVAQHKREHVGEVEVKGHGCSQHQRQQPQQRGDESCGGGRGMYMINVERRLHVYIIIIYSYKGDDFMKTIILKG